MKARIVIRQRSLWALLGLLWLGGTVAGLAWLAGYDNRPGVAARVTAQWPDDSRLARDKSGPTLVMLAHPRCSCTRASIAELAELMARARHRPTAYVVFIKPGGVGNDWDQTDLARSAADIPGVTLVRDDEGLEAQRFGAETSGQTFLYAADGRLLFSGGTTGARGHAGDNAGRATLLALLNHEDPQRTGSPVFGCALFGHDAERQSEEEAGR